MAVVVWRLAGLPFAERPSQPYWIEKGGTVYDVDARGWDVGVRPGMSHLEVSWQYPDGRVIAWKPEMFASAEKHLDQWLRTHMERYAQADPHEGWWQWPNLDAVQFSRLMEHVIPRWAMRVEAGVANHHLLAAAAMMTGKQWDLPVWRGEGFQAHVIVPDQDVCWWPEIPLALIEGVSTEVRKQWRMRGWAKVGQVPGLLARLQNPGPSASATAADEVRLRYVWEYEAGADLIEVLRHLGQQLAERLRERSAGINQLEIAWQGPWGTLKYRRAWPVVTGDQGKILLRVLDFVRKPPPSPPESVEILAERIQPWKPGQLHWAFWTPPHGDVPDIGNDMLGQRPWRETLLQYWDPWRMRRIKGGGR